MSQSTGEQELEQHLLELEASLLDPEVRRDPGRAGRLLADDFVEIGQSGRRYDRNAILQELSGEVQERCIRIEHFQARVLAPGVAMATFQTVSVEADTAASSPRAASRAAPRAARVSLWRRRGDRWLMFYHQGTRIPD